MIFPNIKAKNIIKNDLGNLKELAWDFEKDEPIIKDNDFLIAEGLEALKVWIYKTLKTSRYRFLIYSNAYGSSIKKYIGKVFDTKTKNDFRHEIIDVLLVNDYIISVSIIDYKLDYNKLKIKLKVQTTTNKVLEVDFFV